MIPSNAQDANGLLRTAIRCDDPVLFLEHKHLYRQTYNKGVYPGPDYMIPFGKADGRRARASDVTIVTYGALVQRSLVAARQLRSRGHRDRDPRPALAVAPTTGRPIARACARPARSSSRTRTRRSWGYGAEIAARIADELFEYLDAPVRRIGALDTFVGYAPILEDAILPQVVGHRDAIRDLKRY